MMRHMPANNQQIIALFIKLGHYDSLIHRMHNEFKTRWEIMNTALANHLGKCADYYSSGGTSFWVKGPSWLDTEKLQRKAAQHGILIESGSVFFMQKPKICNYFRLGFSSIAQTKIEPGIKQLAEIIKGMH